MSDIDEGNIPIRENDEWDDVPIRENDEWDDINIPPTDDDVSDDEQPRTPREYVELSDSDEDMPALEKGSETSSETSSAPMTDVAAASSLSSEAEPESHMDVAAASSSSSGDRTCIAHGCCLHSTIV